MQVHELAECTRQRPYACEVCGGGPALQSVRDSIARMTATISDCPYPSAAVSPYRVWQTSSRGDAKFNSLAASATNRLFFSASRIEAWTVKSRATSFGPFTSYT